MDFTLSRGTKDILPEEMGYWHLIEEMSRNIFKYYNYEEIRTPIFETTNLFQRGIGDETDIVMKEMYTFEDKGGRSLTLRPEGTASIARSYLSNNFHKTRNQSKLYYVGPMFRYERPQAGRYRQFHQVGVEHIGSAHPFADAEVISLGVHLFDELGLSGLSVHINSVGCSVCRPVIEERLKQFLSMNISSLCGDCNIRFNKNPLRILDCKNPVCKEYFAGIPDIRNSLCQTCSDHFHSVLEYLEALKINFHINPNLVRGLDYYTRTAFEIVSDQLGAQNTVCGGGRYDNLIETLGGPPTPAVGWAFGVERAVMILQQLIENPAKKDRILAFVAPIGYDQKTRAFYILDELRRAGIKCEMDHEKEELKQQLKVAARLNVRYTIIYGEDEAVRGVVLIRNMDNRNQVEIPVEQLVEYLRQV